MEDRCNLENELKNLKLTKRSYLLEGKNTSSVDIKIKLIEERLKDSNIEERDR